MKERPNIAVEEDTEEMKRCRSLNQSEIDLCWQSLAERNGRGSLGQVQRARTGPSKAEVTPWNGKECAETRNIKLESREKIAGRDLSPCLESTFCSVCKAGRRSWQKRWR